MTVAKGTGAGFVTSSRTALCAVVVVTAVSLVGAVISVQAQLSPSYLDAVGPRGYLSVPLPMTAFQVITAAAAGSTRRSLALLGSALLGLAVTLAVVSGFFDGGYVDDRLDSAQRTYQMVLVLSLCVVAVLAANRFLRVWRSRGDAPT
jgi:hypothetical protein